MSYHLLKKLIVRFILDTQMFKKEYPMNRTKKICIALVILLLGLGIAGSLFIYMRKPSKNLTANIYQDGHLIESIDLSTVRESYTFTVKGSNGAYNKIEVRPGEIAVVEASCPDKVCVNMGFIKNQSLPISCLPNKLVIKIENATDSQNIDGISY